MFFSIRKSILTSKWHAEHPFAGRNTQHTNIYHKAQSIIMWPINILVANSFIMNTHPHKQTFARAHSHFCKHFHIHSHFCKYFHIHTILVWIIIFSDLNYCIFWPAFGCFALQILVWICSFIVFVQKSWKKEEKQVNVCNGMNGQLPLARLNCCPPFGIG